MSNIMMTTTDHSPRNLHVRNDSTQANPSVSWPAGKVISNDSSKMHCDGHYCGTCADSLDPADLEVQGLAITAEWGGAHHPNFESKHATMMQPAEAARTDPQLMVDSWDVDLLGDIEWEWDTVGSLSDSVDAFVDEDDDSLSGQLALIHPTSRPRYQASIREHLQHELEREVVVRQLKRPMTWEGEDRAW